MLFNSGKRREKARRDERRERMRMHRETGVYNRPSEPWFVYGPITGSRSIVSLNLLMFAKQAEILGWKALLKCNVLLLQLK